MVYIGKESCRKHAMCALLALCALHAAAVCIAERGQKLVPHHAFLAPGEMNDAGEVLLTIYERAMGMSPAAAAAVNALCGLAISERVQCASCSKATQQSSYIQYFYSIQVCVCWGRLPCAKHDAAFARACCIVAMHDLPLALTQLRDWLAC